MRGLYNPRQFANPTQTERASQIVSMLLALPWGRTPISTDARPKLANPCNVLGRVVGDAGLLAKVRPGDRVKVEAL